MTHRWPGRWGCHDRIAWSRNGLVAYIANGKVHITWLKCEDGEKWTFTPSVAVKVTSNPVHLSWSRAHYDLAIVDDMGRIQINELTSSGISINHVVSSTTADQRPRAIEQDALVGTYWLGVDKGFVVPTALGIKAESTEQSSNGIMATQKPEWETFRTLGPFHPIRVRGALVCVNGNGVFRLLAQLGDTQYRELETLLQGTESLLFATVVPIGDALLVATYSAKDQIQVYKITITWNNEALINRNNNQEAFAKLTSVPLTSITAVRPPDTLVTAFSFAQIPDFKSTNVPKTFDVNHFEIHTVFTCKNNSHVFIYKLARQSEVLHPAFIALEQQQTAPQELVEAWKLYLSVQQPPKEPIKYYSVREVDVSIIYASGKFEAISLIPVEMNFGKYKVDFSEEQQQVLAQVDHACVSPNLTCVALFKGEETLQLEELSTYKDEKDQQKLFMLANAVATRYAFSVFNHTQCDDMLGLGWRLLYSVMPSIQFNQSMFFNMLASEAQRMLNAGLEPPDDRHVERVIVMPSPLHRWFAFVMVLGTRKGWHRNSGSQLALTAVNIQQVAFALTWSLKVLSVPSKAQNTQQQLAELSSHCYHIMNIMGLVRWTTDLTARIYQELYLTLVQNPQNKEELVKKFIEKPNIFMALMLSKIVRYLLIYVLRGVRGLAQVTQNLLTIESQVGHGDLVKTTHLKFQQILNSAPVPLAHFEKLLTEIDKQLKTVYNSGKLQDRVKQALELEILKHARTPKVLLPIISHIIKSTNLDGVDIPHLYFYDTSWLHLDDVKGLFNEQIDGIRKRVLSGNDTRRQCTRCGIISANDPPKVASKSQFTVLFQRNCLCGGSWQNEDTTDKTISK
ncbi:Mediator of RNA polymerase II transcription subunit 16 [Wickerhamiella sorbophila]|uniref:Mediator of RNA polymerase II transcription subunit 16 n=1 Tax=Wickerhamiella sorbophila TaxID=45607 RepID=A0A2T0FNL7_9ASCO|nr:Mediator of RNA polymerase II transcription subunit 16 [Wickerhamiella sorbophila]PRT56578.1 Mediator of RNA polymerase II transcription subunit 16 [Wickerhamiella sorbophila]